MKKTWLIVAIILGLIATDMLANWVYQLIIGWSIQYGSGYVIGGFFAPFFLYFLTYLAWDKAKQK